MRIRGAIFDMDGTLIDSLSFWGRLWPRIGAHFLGQPDFRPSAEVELALRTMLLDEAIEYFRVACAIPATREELIDFTASDLVDFYKNIATVKAGGRELLTALKAAGVPMVVASATEGELLRTALGFHGLLPYFDSVLSCVDVGAGKEKPDIYLRAAEAMGLAPCEVCVFEDSLVALKTAAAAGFHTVGIFDRHTAGQDEIRAASSLAYVAEGEPLTAALPLL